MPKHPSLTSMQTATKNYLVFAEFKTMDTQQQRQALPVDRLAWCENLQLVGPNSLLSVPGPAPALAMIGGHPAQKLFYAYLGGVDYEIYCSTDGSMYAVNASSGTSTQIAPTATFTNPDVTVWQSAALLIADALAGYCAWNGSCLSQVGGVSPNLIVTAGGSGYGAGATAAITGGHGSGATATVQVVGGIVVGLTLTSAGTGYLAADTLTVTITAVSGGSGATATAKVWPTLPVTPTTLAVYQGRVWIAGGRVLVWTGTAGYDDAASADAYGFTTIADADLVHQITALRALNNYLWIFGDNSVKQIGTISISGTSTIFSIITLASDVGTTFPLTIQSYNRLVLFANKTGVYAVLGASVEKLSAEMDGIFQDINFAQSPVAALNDINSIRCYLLLVRYNDPLLGYPRSLILVFQNRKWWVASQGNSVAAMSTAVIAGSLETFVSSGNDVTQILESTTAAVNILLRTALSHHGKPWMGKKALRAATAQSSASLGSMNMTIDTENGSVAANYSVSFPITWLNALGQVVNWVNRLAQQVIFSGTGFLFQRAPASGTGIYLGLTLSGSFTSGYNFNNGIVEYQETTALASKVSN